MATEKKAPKQSPQKATRVPVAAKPPVGYPLFKGATRIPTLKGGVPTRAFIGLLFLTLIVASFTLWGWLLLSLYPVMAVISRNDDRAFWIWELWLRTKFMARNKRFWGAISFTPTPQGRRRPWRKRMQLLRRH